MKPKIQGFYHLLHKVTHIDLFKVFSLNAISTVIKMSTNLLSIKIVAYMIGPSGVALLGQLTNFSSIMLAFANGGITNGITKYVAENKESPQSFVTTLSTSLKITLACSALIGVLLITFSGLISRFVLYDRQYYYVFVILGVTISLYALNTFLISVVNGLSRFRLYVTISIVGSIISLVSSILLVLMLGLAGALINAVVFQSIVFFATAWMCRREEWFKFNSFKEKIDKALVKKLLGFSLMAITTAVLLPLAQLIIRDNIISVISFEAAGWWEGMNRVSTMYLYIIMTAFNVYYLPKLSETKSIALIRHEIKKCGLFLIPIVICSFFVLYFGRFFVIKLLFTSSFLPMKDLFFWQLTGDSIKIFSWLFSYLLVSKACIKEFMVAEFISTCVYLLLSLFMIKEYGVIGLVQSYLFKCVIYFSLMALLSKKYWI